MRNPEGILSPVLRNPERIVPSDEKCRTDFHPVMRNPEGILSSSPGLPRQRLPWVTGNHKIDNPERVVSIARMPQSLSAVYGHLIFSTKERRPFFRDAAKRAELHAYLGGISKRLDCAPIIVGGVEDHVHLLGRIGRTITHAHWVKELKRVSSIWLKQQGPGYADFRWQVLLRLCAAASSGLSEPIHKQPQAGAASHPIRCCRWLVARPARTRQRFRPQAIQE